MLKSDIKKVIREIEHEHRRQELRQEFLTKGVKFYDKNGWGYIRNGVKNYMPSENHYRN